MTIFLSKLQTSHKDKLIKLAMRVGGSGVSGWTLARVTKCFQHQEHGFMEMDVVVVLKGRDRVEVLCTRSLAVTDLPEECIENFTSLEEPFQSHRLVLPER